MGDSPFQASLGPSLQGEAGESVGSNLAPIRVHNGDYGVARIGKLLDKRADECRVRGEVSCRGSSAVHGWHGWDVNLIASGFEGIRKLGVCFWNVPASMDEDEGWLDRCHLAGAGGINTNVCEKMPTFWYLYKEIETGAKARLAVGKYLKCLCWTNMNM